MEGGWERVGTCSERVMVRELDGCGGCEESYGALLGM